ncbi:MAG: 3-deoxy-7-phosphoheptulonate synthase [Arenicellales bacterium]
MLNQTATDNLRIVGTEVAITPADLISQHPISDQAEQTVLNARQQAHEILHGQDDRLIVICGPCSIHDLDAANEYALGLNALRELYKDQLHIIMRVYFEKPRTTIGWKGLINDPNLNGTFEINKGLETARSLLLELNDMGMPCGTEFLDLISPQYFADLISWGAIGARTTESQSHRELASGLSCPVGFKNGTNGNLQIAADAIGAASKPHHFLSVTKSGKSAIFGTSGNEDCHVILRGGTEPNYDATSIQQSCELLEKSNLKPMVMIDMSHANSHKKHQNQIPVGENIAAQVAGGEDRIIGVMIESNLVEGNQSLNADTPLVYGQSITDACVNFDQTKGMIRTLADAVDARRASKTA